MLVLVLVVIGVSLGGEDTFNLVIGLLCVTVKVGNEDGEGGLEKR